MKLWVYGLFLLICLIATSKANAIPIEQVILTTSNTVVLRGRIDDNSVNDIEFKLFLMIMERGIQKYPIYLVLDSPGGDIEAGLNFIQFVKTLNNVKTITIFSASMASGIVEALPGERLMTENGVFMFHRAHGRFQGYFETGEVESTLWAAKAMMRKLEDSNANRMRMSIIDYKALVVNELWLYGTDAITYRAADHIVEIRCTPELIKKEIKVGGGILDMLFGSGSMTFSACPLLRAPKSGNKNMYLVPSTENYNTIRAKYLKN